jgi:uncharacterized protein YndB with AHSA1/START domain
MSGRRIRKEVNVQASPEQVWEAWTTPDGVTAFFAPQARIELSIGGAYEMLFTPDAPEGSKGGEGLRILSYLPGEMLSFEWNAPPSFPEIRTQKTWVVVQMDACGEDRTRVRLTHLGWGKGERWDQVFAYFVRAWDVVLGRLRHRLEQGPIDWDAPFTPPN